MIVESELWPNLIVGASENGVSVVIILYGSSCMSYFCDISLQEDQKLCMILSP